MWSSGSLGDNGIYRVLLLLAARNASGTLSVQADDVLAVRFRNGEIVGADALKESLTHGLGRILVAAGHLNRDQVAILESAELEGSVIDHLLASGLVPADTLAGCVRQHTYLLLLRLLGWKSGDYQFYEGEVAIQSRAAPALGRRSAGASLRRGSSVARWHRPAAERRGVASAAGAARVPCPQLAGARPGSRRRRRVVDAVRGRAAALARRPDAGEGLQGGARGRRVPAALRAPSASADGAGGDGEGSGRDQRRRGSGGANFVGRRLRPGCRQAGGPDAAHPAPRSTGPVRRPSRRPGPSSAANSAI